MKTRRVVVLTALLVFAISAAIAFAQECDNTCTTYPEYWKSACPSGERCITFKNNCLQPISLYYSIGCNADGNPGAPTCDCTEGPTIPAGESVYWQIVDANDSSACEPKVTPACLTSGLAVIANYAEIGGTCASGTRVEFTAGNHADPYGKFDSYNIDVEKNWYSMPVAFTPDVNCTHSSNPLDCRPLWCNSSDCPDAYISSTTGGCPDGRSPQGNCQDTFGNFGTPSGFIVEFCPADGQSCQECAICPSSSVSGFAWIDSDRDGLQDTGEAGLSGVSVSLFDSNETLVRTNTTNTSGHYNFINLFAGDYLLEFLVPGNYRFAPSNRGADPAIDSDSDPASGRTEIFGLENGQNHDLMDAGFVPLLETSRCDANYGKMKIGNQSARAYGYLAQVSNNLTVDKNQVRSQDLNEEIYPK